MRPTEKAELIQAWNKFLISLGYTTDERRDIIDFVSLLTYVIDDPITDSKNGLNTFLTTSIERNNL